MHYHEFAPSAALAATVLRYWQFEVAATLAGPVPHKALPDGCVSLIVFRTTPLAPPTALWAGPRTTHFRQVTAPGSAFAGIRFVPGAARALFGLDMAGLKNASRLAQPELERQPLLAAIVRQPLCGSWRRCHSSRRPSTGYWKRPGRAASTSW